LAMRYDTDAITDYSGQRFGNYRLIRLLGSGGLASVYLGEHVYLQRPAAIKVLHTILDEQDKERFLEEAKLLANLSHRHIVRVLEFAVTTKSIKIQDRKITEHIPIIIMDYVPGGNLRSLYPGGSCLFFDTVVDYIQQTASALQYAHDQGIIHRDIKPENLLLNERQEIMLSDFGLALFAPSPQLLSTQQMAGTLPYTAPEQLQGKPEFASDQYSLAVIAYEWLCGRRPFEGEELEIIMQHISSPPLSLRSLNSAIPAPVEEVVLKGLAKDPRQRYSSVQEFAHALMLASTASTFDYLHNLHLPHEAIAPVAIAPTLPRLHDDIHLVHDIVQSVTSTSPTSAIAIQEQRTTSPEQHLAYFSSSRRNRQRMLRKVRSYWITGVLERSLYTASQLNLELRERRDAVANPWSFSLYQTEKRIQSLPPATSITQAYDSVGGELLILGDAGSGKTTLLLELARDLLDRAEKDETMPIPVILTLSSWSEKRQPFAEWLIEELYNKYLVSHTLGEQWLRSKMLLPLLDGLDEVTENARSACIIALNNYRKEQGQGPLVVCSRLTEYLLYPPRILLSGAVVIQPLTRQQVESFLLGAGEKLESVYQAYCHDPILQKLVTTPFMLNIIALAYQGKSTEEVLAVRASQQRYQQIFSTYVEQMLLRNATSAYTPQEVIHWLSCQARQLKRHNQTIFYLEHLQPDWIDSLRWRRVYAWLAIWLPGALIGTLVGALSNDLFFYLGHVFSIFSSGLICMMMGFLLSRRKTAHFLAGVSTATQNRPKKRLVRGEHLTTGLFLGLMAGLFSWLANVRGTPIIGAERLVSSISLGLGYGLINGLCFGVVSFLLSLLLLRENRLQQNAVATGNGQTRTQRFHPLLARIMICTLIAVVYQLVFQLALLPKGSLSHQIQYVLSNGFSHGLDNALFGILLSLLLKNNDETIHPTEIVSWSYRRFWQMLKDYKILALSLLIGTIFTVNKGFGSMIHLGWYYVLHQELRYAPLIAINYCLVVAILSTITNQNLDDHVRSRPNEGIRRSLLYALFGGAIGAFGSILAFILLDLYLMSVVGSFHGGNIIAGLRNGLMHGWYLSLYSDLKIGLIGSLLAFLLFGGLAWLQHGLLRLILWRTGELPLSPSHFLDYASRCVLLYKVGGGYIFVHRLLLEYFLSIDR
jgi:serine/threonine protein kinase